MIYKIRYKKDINNPNLGFSESEIQKLISLTNLKFPELYLDFLKIAGKRSNVLNHFFENIEELIELQIKIKTKIENSDINEFNFNIWCFSYSKEKFYYFEIDECKNPTVLIYTNETYPVDNGWNNKLGYISENLKFIDFINSKTNDKYGFTFVDYIKHFLLLVLFSPLLLILFLYLEIRIRKSN